MELQNDRYTDQLTSLRLQGPIDLQQNGRWKLFPPNAPTLSKKIRLSPDPASRTGIRVGID